MKERPIAARLALACLALRLAVSSATLPAKELTSGDGYVRADERTSTWTLGTAMVEQRLQLARGVLALANLENNLG